MNGLAFAQFRLMSAELWARKAYVKCAPELDDENWDKWWRLMNACSDLGVNSACRAANLRRLGGF